MEEINIWPKEEINLGTKERMVSALAGSAMVLSALTNGKSLFKLGIGGYLLFRGATGHCPLYKGLSKNVAEMKSDNINIRTTVTVDRPRNEVYSFWRRLENLPLFMEHLESVRMLDEKYSEWKANIRGGSISWKSEIVKDEVNERIGWRSVEGSDVEHAGNVHFEDDGASGTVVHAVISYRLPGGTPTIALGRLINPVFERMVREDIRNFKKYIETGMV